MIHSLSSTAPDSKHVYWDNVGLAHDKQQFGNLIAKASTVGLCFFWTIPVTFITSLAEVDQLKKRVPFLEKMIEKHPQLEPALAVLKPLLLVLLMNSIPNILAIFCRFEG